jgi:hypothetical protein
MSEFRTWHSGQFGTSIATVFIIDEYGKKKVVGYEAYIPGAAGPQLFGGRVGSLAQAQGLVDQFIDAVFQAIRQFHAEADEIGTPDYEPDDAPSM